MTRKTITIFAALVAVALLIGGYFGAQAWIKAHPKPSPYSSRNFPETPRLTDFESSKIIRIENVGEGFTLEKRGNNWALASAKIPIEKVNLDQDAISSKLWSISSVWSESVVDENPVDLSEFGLDEPRGHTIVTDSNGKKAELFIGNYTPSRTSHYVMTGGDRAVYTVSSYSMDNLLFSLDNIRNKSLFTNFDPMALTRFILEPWAEDNPAWKGRIDIVPKTEDDYLITGFTSYVLNAPYASKQGVDSEKFHNLLQSLTEMRILEFINDEPASLAPFGLDKPGRLYVESPGESLNLLFGKGENGIRYAKLAGESPVFALEGFEPLAQALPFTLMDKFAYIFNIDHVDSLTITGEGTKLEATIQGTGDDAIFHLNGRRTQDKEFRTFYQAVIGLLVDAEYTGPPARGDGTDILVEYNLNTPRGIKASLRLVPYNRNFFVLEKEGTSEFLIARTQARKIFETADSMVYAE